MPNPRSLKDVVVVIGMPRAGTTWLYENLKNHPQICTSEYKEINRYLRSLTDAQYLSYFKHSDQSRMLDVSPLYFFDLNALKTISRKHDKVILLVRHPDEWIHSLQMQIAKYSKDLDSMVRSQKYILPIEGDLNITFDFGAYQHAEYIDGIRKIFADDLLEVEFASLQRDPLGVLKTVEHYLGLSSYFNSQNSSLGKVNSSQSKISPFYLSLQRTKLIHKVLPLLLKILPKKMIHWLRRRYVYGD